MRIRRLVAFPIALALLLGALAGAGCGSAWTRVPLEGLSESTEDLGGEYARFVLDDDRVLELRVVSVAYPYVEGNRVLGTWSTPRRIRVDLRSVTRLDVRPGAS
jgi:hypothetical protein